MPEPGFGEPDGAKVIGQWGDVRIEVAPHDAVTVGAALAIVGVFTREAAGNGPGGGLKHLDTALNGALLRLRSDGIFGAAPGELLTLTAVSPPIQAHDVIAVGLGDPDAFTPAGLRLAVSAAAQEAIRLAAPSAAFAPSLLDSGIDRTLLPGAESAMLGGLIDALATRSHDVALSCWIFCAGAEHLDAVAAAFRDALLTLDRR
ncbi:M17 family peptidase N-terminal domain-containing protein [Sphingomonas sp. MMS24-J45]|uniref:M17 family peptidase N-terminal domain-containing protein n=1 Tax=Sphingomonas sp. MMS24-J45 TaxID=3238806 RepID=UPI00384E4CA8